MAVTVDLYHFTFLDACPALVELAINVVQPAVACFFLRLSASASNEGMEMAARPKPNFFSAPRRYTVKKS